MLLPFLLLLLFQYHVYYSNHSFISSRLYEKYESIRSNGYSLPGDFKELDEPLICRNAVIDSDEDEEEESDGEENH